MRDAIRNLLKLGPLPDSIQAQDQEDRIVRFEQLLTSISPPLTDEEAEALAGLFGPDDCYGLAWTMLHLIETAPGWPIIHCLIKNDNEWIRRLRESARRAGRVTDDI